MWLLEVASLDSTCALPGLQQVGPQHEPTWEHEHSFCLFLGYPQ